MCEPISQRKTDSAGGGASREGGFALLAALLIVLLLAVVLAEFAHYVNLQSRLTANRVSRAAAEGVLDGVEEYAIAQIMRERFDTVYPATILSGHDFRKRLEMGRLSLNPEESQPVEAELRISTENTRIPLFFLTPDNELASRSENYGRVESLLKALQVQLPYGTEDITRAITRWQAENKRSLAHPFELLDVFKDNPSARFLVCGGRNTNGEIYAGLAEFVSCDMVTWDHNALNDPKEAKALLRYQPASEFMRQVINTAQKKSLSLISEVTTRPNYFRIEITGRCGKAKAFRTTVCRTYLRKNEKTGMNDKEVLEILFRVGMRCNTGEFIFDPETGGQEENPANLATMGKQ